MRLLQHHNSISSSLKQNSKSEDFTSALLEHIYNYRNHFILFGNVSLISRDQGLKQIFRETIEIKKKKLFKNNSINRDTGEFGLNSIYDNLPRSNKVNLISPKSFDLCPPDLSDKSNEPEPKKSRRFASAVALKKKNKSNKLYVISLLGINFVYFYSCLLVLLLMMNTVYVLEKSS